MTIVANKTEFTTTYADSNATWRVMSKRSGDVWNCEIVGNADYEGTKKVFTTGDINRAVAFDAALDRAFGRSGDFWSVQKVGTVLHYHNSFGKFIRGTVIEQDGVKCLRMDAMVGAWDARDLPKRRLDGEVVLGYHAKIITEGRTDRPWQPNEGSIYEYPGFSYAGCYPDPRKETPLSLTPPESSPKEKRIAALEKKRLAIIDLLSSENIDRRNIEGSLLSMLSKVSEMF